jgi:hypothetical protein
MLIAEDAALLIDVGHADGLLGDRAGRDPPQLGPLPGLLPAQRRPVLTDQEVTPTLDHTEDPPRAAEVPIGDPEVVGRDPWEHRVDQGPLLGIGVLARHDVADQHRRRVEHDQGLPRQRGGAGRAGRRRAMLGPGQVVAIEDPCPVAGHGLGERTAVEALHDRRQPVVGLEDEAAADGRLDPLKLGVDGRQRSHQLVERGEVGGADGRMDLGDDSEHQLDHRGEEQLAGALGLGRVVKEPIELRGIQGALQQGAEHDGDGAGLEEAFEERTQLHGAVLSPRG